MQVHRFDRNEIPNLIKLANKIGWGYNTENWEHFFKLGIIVGHKDENENPISCGVLVLYSNSIGWLTSFIVSPDHRRKGLAKEVWNYLKKEIGIRRISVGLVSTEEGLPFYHAMGFSLARKVFKYTRENGHAFPDQQVDTQNCFSEIQTDDLSLITATDKNAFGFDRREMLKGKLLNAIRAFKVVDSKGYINGFAIGVNEGGLLCIGPIIAESDEIALDLILKIAKGSNIPIRMDLNEGHTPLSKALEEKGFKLERIPPVMSLNGQKQLPPLPQNYIGLAAQALG